jgi:hypothetical protein
LVDQRVAAQDERFRTESAELEKQLEEQGNEAFTSLAKAFVIRHGGRLPSDPEVAARKSVAGVGIKKERTQEITRALVAAGVSVAEIAARRGLVTSTIYGHLEELLDEGTLTEAQVKAIILPLDIETGIKDISTAIKKHGVAALKPLFLELNEKYDYGELRILRALHSARERGAG